MGSCNQCIQKQDPIKSVRIYNIPIKQSPQNHQMAIKIQSAYRSYITRQKFNLKLAEKRGKHQIKCNSNEDLTFEKHTQSYSPMINYSDVSNTYSSIQNNQNQRAHYIFNRQQSLKLQPKETDQFDFEKLIQKDQTVLQKYLQSSNNCSETLKNQKEKINQFKFHCVLTLEIQLSHRRFSLKGFITLILGQCIYKQTTQYQYSYIQICNYR